MIEKIEALSVELEKEASSMEIASGFFIAGFKLLIRRVGYLSALVEMMSINAQLTRMGPRWEQEQLGGSIH